jgi:ABC-type transport system involved in multi-copper enzyme maturation permease subunit
MAQLRAELLKQTSTRTDLGLFAGLLGLVLLAIVLHGLGLRAEELGQRKNQLMILGRGEFLAALFAALLGAMSITAEIRHGTIRPIFVVTPQRGRVIAAKVGVSVVIGAAFGLVASAFAAGVGIAVLRARGIDVQLDAGDYLLLILGGGVAAALWAAIGVGVGAVVRNQVPALVGLAAWLLFVEGLLGGDLGDLGRFAPGALGMAASGQEPDTLLPPALGVLLLAVYAVVAVGAAWLATTRRDVP